jgi:signal transduction histidine kinase
VSSSGIDADPRVLGRLLAAQSNFPTLPSPRQMCEFVSRAMEVVPGVASCTACIAGSGRPHLGGELVPECSDCDLPGVDIDHDPGHPCRLPSSIGIRVYPLRIQDRYFGFLLLKVKEPEQYSPYEPFVSNLANGLAVSVERQWQKDLVEKRTVELQTANSLLQASNAELEQANAELTRARQGLGVLMEERDRFVATVSHELRTPLSGVLGFASELRDSVGRFTPAEVAEFAGLIAQGCATANNLVEDLLMATRLEAGDLALQLGLVDLHQRALAASADSKAVPWPQGKVIAVEGESAVAWADSRRLDQILRNLVGNAARYGGILTTLVTGVTASPREAFLRVVDDGPGVTGGLVDRLFQSYQHGPQESGRTESVGLGLYISRRLAQLMGGDLTYRRQDGTTIFELTFPLPDPAT